VAKNRWVDGSNVRFFKGLTERIGGWIKLTDKSLSAAARGIMAWRGLDGTGYIALGTHAKLWLYTGDTLYDITPIRASGSLTDPYQTTNTSAVVTVTHVGHGAATGDTVIFDTSAVVGGVTISGAYVVTVLTTDTYTITAATTATSTASGGGSISYRYEITIGALGGGDPVAWGEGTWGNSVWGGIEPYYNTPTEYRVWSFATFGEDLIASPYGGGIYHWDKTGGTGARAVVVTNAPTTTYGIFVSDARHLVALGDSSDPLLVKWASEEVLTNWTPAPTSTAGDFRVQGGVEFRGSVETRFGRLLLTDHSAHVMRYTGAPFVFSITKQAESCGLAGPAAIVSYDGVAYWMSDSQFFMYNGTVQRLDCDLHADVFEDINRKENFKITAGTNDLFNEVWWFYTSASESEVDRFVLYNVREGTWSKGTIGRTSWLGENPVTNFPIGTDATGAIFLHESDVNGDGAAVPYYLQSGDLEAGNGDVFTHIRKIIPDYERLTGDHQITLLTKKYPQDAASTKGPYLLNANSDKVSVRARGRSIAMKLSSSAIDADFRIGEFRAAGTRHGAR